MLDKIIAWGAIAALVAFMGILVTYINEPDLWIVVVIVLVMAAYDFWRTLRQPKEEGNGPEQGAP